MRIIKRAVGFPQSPIIDVTVIPYIFYYVHAQKIERMLEPYKLITSCSTNTLPRLYISVAICTTAILRMFHRLRTLV